MGKSMRMPLFKEKADAHVWIRIFDNQHLLDATEIFRKLNVHKKVRNIQPSIVIGHL